MTGRLQPGEAAERGSEKGVRGPATAPCPPHPTPGQTVLSKTPLPCLSATATSVPVSRPWGRRGHGGDSDPRGGGGVGQRRDPGRPPALLFPLTSAHPEQPHPSPRVLPTPAPPARYSPLRPHLRPPRAPRAPPRPAAPSPNRYLPPARRSPPSGPAAGPASPRARAPRPAAQACPAPPPAATGSRWTRRRLSLPVAGSAPRPPAALPSGRRCHGNRARALCACPAAPRPGPRSLREPSCGNAAVGGEGRRRAGPGGAGNRRGRAERRRGLGEGRGLRGGGHTAPEEGEGGACGGRGLVGREQT